MRYTFLTVLLVCASACSAQTLPQQCRQFQDALAAASTLRGLVSSKSPRCLVLDKGEFASRTKLLFADDGPGELERGEIALKLLGLISPEFAYAECLSQDPIANVTAFYLPEEDAIIIPGWRPTPQEVLVHEAVHALQHQRYDLDLMRKRAEDSTDANLALAALIEGDAVHVANTFKKNAPPAVSAGKSDAEPLTPCSFPVPLLHQYEFPYSSGLRFVLGALKQKRPEILDELFKTPPLSTTEVLYRFSKRPELARFAVSRPSVELPSGYEPEKWAPCAQDTLGEYTIRSILREQLLSTPAVRGAMGWRGDRYLLYCGSDTRSALLVWKSLWGSAEDASEFFNVYRQAQAKRGWGAMTSNVTGGNAEWSGEGPGGIKLRLELTRQAVRFEAFVPDTGLLLTRKPDTR